VNPSEPKRASLQCAYCARNVSETLRVHCAVCDDCDLCCECFSVGVSLSTHVGPAPTPAGQPLGAPPPPPPPGSVHQPWHAYLLVDSLAFPFLTFDWTAEEELTLLEALETHGMANWTEVADAVGTKSKTQCHAHYCDRYLSAPTAPLPDLAAVIGKEGACALAAAQDAAAAAAAAASAPGGGGHAEAAAAAAAAAAGACAFAGVPLSAGAAAALALASTGIAEEAAKAALLASFARPCDARLEGNSAELTGFNAKRAEFETEFDGEAELPLADMDFRKEDTPEERALKLRMVHVYNARLDERAQRRAFILDRGLLNVKRTQAAERRRTPEERELAARCRVLARFHSAAEHEALLEGLAVEARLRARAEELKEWRRAGIASLAEGEAYEADKRRRATERARIRALDCAAAAAAATAAAACGKLPPNARTNRYLSRDAPAPPPPPGGAAGGAAPGAAAAAAAPKPPAESGKGAAAAAAAAAALAPSARRPKAGVFLDLTGLPGAELLSGRERELCSTQRLVPVHYLALKEALLRQHARDGTLRRADARAMFRLDAHRVGAVFDLLLACGWITGDAPRGARASLEQPPDEPAEEEAAEEQKDAEAEEEAGAAAAES
jgi:transcriptional adapter 2-alpha